MATPQEDADNAFRAYEAAVAQYNAIVNSPMGGSMAAAAAAQVAAATAASHTANDALKASQAAPTPTGGGGGQVTATSTYTPPPAAFSASQILNNLLKAALGIEGLGDWALGLQNRGASTTEIVQSLRYGTDSSAEGQAAYQKYLAAFPKMDTFIKQGIFAGENPEKQYIEYRNTTREAAARYNIDSALLNDEKIASYIENRTSAAELVDRMNMAATAASTTSPELLATLRDYYNIQSGDLTSFYLDPDTTESALKSRYTAAQIGTEALRQDFGVSRTEAENLALQGLTAAEANKAFSTANAQKAFTTGAGETATREDILKNVTGQAEAAQKLTRIASTRVGKFQQGGSFLQEKQGGVAGLQSANTP